MCLQCRRCRRQIQSLGGEDPLEKEKATHSQYSCPENPMNRGAWWATVYEVAKRWRRLSGWHITVALQCHVCFCCTEKVSSYTYTCVLCRFSRVGLFVTPGLRPTRLLRPWDSPGQNTGVGCHALLQGIFSTQGSNPQLLRIAGRFFTTEPPGKPHMYTYTPSFLNSFIS